MSPNIILFPEYKCTHVPHDVKFRIFIINLNRNSVKLETFNCLSFKNA